MREHLHRLQRGTEQRERHVPLFADPAGNSPKSHRRLTLRGTYPAGKEDTTANLSLKYIRSRYHRDNTYHPGFYPFRKSDTSLIGQWEEECFIIRLNNVKDGGTPDKSPGLSLAEYASESSQNIMAHLFRQHSGDRSSFLAARNKHSYSRTTRFT